MNQKRVTDIREKPEEMMLHEVPVVSGFWVTEGLKQTSLCTKDVRVQDRQTDNEQNTKLLMNTKWSIFFQRLLIK